MLNGKKVGLVLGSFVAFLHIVWVFLIVLNWAEPLLHFIYRMHFIQIPVTFLPLDLGRAAVLILIAFVVGNIMGNLFSFFWNRINK